MSKDSLLVPTGEGRPFQWTHFLQSLLMAPLLDQIYQEPCILLIGTEGSPSRAMRILRTFPTLRDSLRILGVGRA